MNLFEKYYSEILGRETVFFEVENQKVGFLVFEKLPDGNIFVQDCFVEKEFRKKNVGSSLVREVIKKNPQAKKIFSNVRLYYKTANESLIAQLVFGFRIFKIENNETIYLEKDVEKWET